jgi:hypothetical protein
MSLPGITNPLFRIMTMKMRSYQSTLAITASIMAACGAQAYELNLGTNVPAIDFHGFASQGFLATSSYNYLDSHSKSGSFRFNEEGLNCSLNPFPHTRITAQAFSFDLGSVNKNAVFLDYASIEYTFNDQLGLRGGRVRRPGGIYNDIQDIDLARTYVLLPQGMYDARWRDFSTSIDGGEVFGSFSLGKAGSLSYEAFAGYMNISMDGGVARYAANGLPPGGTLNSFSSPLMIGNQLWWNTPVSGLRAGAMLGEIYGFDYYVTVPSLAGPTQVATKGDLLVQQYSLEYLINNWTLQAEFFNFAYNHTSTYHNAFVSIPPDSDADRPETWYAGAAYRFNKWLEVGSYYTEFYGDSNHTGGGPGANQKDLALSFRIDPKPWWVFKVEGHYIHGTALLRDNNSNPNQSNNGWFMLAVKTTFSF